MDVGFLLIATTATGDLAALARRAEAAGFESLWIPEHPVIPVRIETEFPFHSELPEHYAAGWRAERRMMPSCCSSGCGGAGENGSQNAPECTNLLIRNRPSAEDVAPSPPVGARWLKRTTPAVSGPVT